MIRYTNKKEALEAFEKSTKIMLLDDASDELRDDKDVVIAALKNWHSNIQEASERLKNDIDVLAAFKDSLFKSVAKGIYLTYIERLEVLELEQELLKEVPTNTSKRALTKF